MRWIKNDSSWMSPLSWNTGSRTIVALLAKKLAISVPNARTLSQSCTESWIRSSNRYAKKLTSYQKEHHNISFYRQLIKKVRKRIISRAWVEKGKRWQRGPISKRVKINNWNLVKILLFASLSFMHPIRSWFSHVTTAQLSWSHM